MMNRLSKPVCWWMREKRAMWTVIVAVALIAGYLTIPVKSEACCFYNSADDKITVKFDCGVFCWNVWDLSPGQHKCRPGKNGYVTLYHNQKDPCELLPVAKHGWVNVYHVQDKGVAESKDENGNTTNVCEFDWGN
ncbi:MAG TPA: hypothetical protein PLO63_03735 [Syntrophales bacterium]|nr:hypothetical protein [Syntrophales bacterium]